MLAMSGEPTYNVGEKIVIMADWYDKDNTRKEHSYYHQVGLPNNDQMINGFAKSNKFYIYKDNVTNKEMVRNEITPNLKDWNAMGDEWNMSLDDFIDNISKNDKNFMERAISNI